MLHSGAMTLLSSILEQVRLTTIVDIGITALLIYWLFSLIRGTRAVRLVIGVSVLVLVYALAVAFDRVACTDRRVSSLRPRQPATRDGLGFERRPELSPRSAVLQSEASWPSSPTNKWSVSRAPLPSGAVSRS